jgi:streptogramin lyase
VLALLAGAAVVVIAVVLLTGGGKDDNNASAPGTGTTTTGTASARPVTNQAVDPRPNAIAYASGRVWVGSPRTNRLIGLAADGKSSSRTIRLPWSAGTTSIAAGYGSLWVTNGPESRVVRIDPRTGHLQGDRVIGSGEAVVVAIGEGSVWVGRRAEKSTDPPSSVVKIDPHGGDTKEILFGQEGVGDLTVGGGYVWVANRRRARLSRIDPGTGARKSTPIGLGKHRVAYAGGQVWVSNYDDNTISQNTRALDNAATVPLDVRGPLGLTSSGSTLLVVSNLDDKVVRISTRTGRPVGDPILVGRNPFAIAVHGKVAWVTNVASGSVSRIALG